MRVQAYQTLTGHERTIQGLLKTARTINAALLRSPALADKARFSRAEKQVRSAIHDIRLLAFEVADAVAITRDPKEEE